MFGVTPSIVPMSIVFPPMATVTGAYPNGRKSLRNSSRSGSNGAVNVASAKRSAERRIVSPLHPDHSLPPTEIMTFSLRSGIEDHFTASRELDELIRQEAVRRDEEVEVFIDASIEFSAKLKERARARERDPALDHEVE